MFQNVLYTKCYYVESMARFLLVRTHPSEAPYGTTLLLLVKEQSIPFEFSCNIKTVKLILITVSDKEEK